MSTAALPPPEQKAVHAAVLGLMRYFESAAAVPHERRQHTRTLFVHPLTVITADQCRLAGVSRDLSLNGMRILGGTSLVGETVGIVIARQDGQPERWHFRLKVLWSSSIGDGLVDSGGVFVGIVRVQA